MRRFEVALSFPGEHRDRVEKIAEALAAARLGDQKKILYDRWHSAEFARPNLGMYLPDLYNKESELIVAFLCEDYEKKEWCGLEWRAIFELIKRKQDERIMLICVDDMDIAKMPGLYSTDGSLPIRAMSDETVAAMILERLAMISKPITVLAPTVPPRAVPHRTFISKLPTVDPNLFGRAPELAFLDTAWADPNTNAVQIIAPGGTGKTALMTNWYRRHLKDAPVYGWSFYSQGTQEKSQTSSDPFFDHAISWFGLNVAATATIFEKADALVECLRNERVLLILDGVEPLQDKEGDLRDLAVKALVRELAVSNAGMVLLTTRVKLTDIPDEPPRVLSLDLSNLDPADAAHYLAHLGVKGEEQELREASAAYGNHALAITLLGTYLVTFCEGDIRRRTDVKELQIEETKPGRHARKVMASYARMYEGQPELDILHALGYFDHPAEQAAFRLVRPKLEFPKYQAALWRLYKARLILTADPKHPIDCHPLVREYFSANATPAGHALLYEHYKKQAKHRPDTLEEMTPLFHAVYHGCKAGKQTQCCDEVFKDRILRDNRQPYPIRYLGAPGTVLSLLANFFSTPWTEPDPGLPAAHQAWLTHNSGFILRCLGRLADAIAPLRAGIDEAVTGQHWVNVATSYNNLCELYSALGNLAEAIDAGGQAVRFADSSGEWFERFSKRAILAEALHQSGDSDGARRLFEEAEHISAKNQPQFKLLYSIAGCSYCELLLDEGKNPEVLRRASQTLNWTEGRLLDIGLDHVSLGRAHPPGSKDSADNLDQGVDFLRRAGQLVYLPRALLARGTPRDLEEVFRIATRSGMRLHLTDYHLASARLALSNGDTVTAREHFDKAERLIKETGYHRRDGELAALRSQI